LEGRGDATINPGDDSAEYAPTSSDHDQAPTSYAISSRGRGRVRRRVRSNFRQELAVYNLTPLGPLPVPVPVPNLTKKSRGRRVPVSLDSSSEMSSPARPHVCEVLDCGKRFVRGEHLKRHVRSIHTHEKRRWLCPLPNTCAKISPLFRSSQMSIRSLQQNIQQV